MCRATPHQERILLTKEKEKMNNEMTFYLIIASLITIGIWLGALSIITIYQEIKINALERKIKSK